MQVKALPPTGRGRLINQDTIRSQEPIGVRLLPLLFTESTKCSDKSKLTKTADVAFWTGQTAFWAIFTEFHQLNSECRRREFLRHRTTKSFFSSVASVYLQRKHAGVGEPEQTVNLLPSGWVGSIPTASTKECRKEKILLVYVQKCFRTENRGFESHSRLDSSAWQSGWSQCFFWLLPLLMVCSSNGWGYQIFNLKIRVRFSYRLL